MHQNIVYLCKTDSTHWVFARQEMRTMEGQPRMYTVQLVRWVKFRSILFTSLASIRRTWPSWSPNPHSGATGNFDTLLTDDGPSVVLEQMGPSVASGWEWTVALFCLTEKGNFFGGSRSSLHCAKCVQRDRSSYKWGNRWALINMTEIDSCMLCYWLSQDIIRKTLTGSLGFVALIMPLEICSLPLAIPTTECHCLITSTLTTIYIATCYVVNAHKGANCTNSCTHVLL